MSEGGHPGQVLTLPGMKQVYVAEKGIAFDIWQFHLLN